MQNHATGKGGLCLSDKYSSFNEELKWKCLKHNYEWNATVRLFIIKSFNESLF